MYDKVCLIIICWNYWNKNNVVILNEGYWYVCVLLLINSVVCVFKEKIFYLFYWCFEEGFLLN